MFFLVILFISTLNLAAQSLPIVDKGVFVITGVKTCGSGSGYCVLGSDCSVDKEFAADPNGGHCDGLRKAFTPRAYFVCCEYVDETTTTSTSTTTTSSTTHPSVSSDEGTSNENDSSPETKESTSIESLELDDKPGNETLTSPPVPVGSLNDTTDTTGVTVTTDKLLPIDTNSVVVTPETTVPNDPSTIQTGLSDDVVEDNSLSNLLPTTTLSTSSSSSQPSSETGQESPASPQEVETTTITTITRTTRPFSGEKESQPSTPTTTTISYSEKTEISVEESVSLHVKQCGMKMGTTNSRVDSPRLATQGANSGTSTCWTGAIVRSPTTMSMQADPGSFLCSGALIHPSVLLTTATCVSRLFAQDLSLFKVALGSSHLVHPLHGPTPDADYKDIKELIIHESYAIDGHLRINDIALVLLASPADLSRTCTLCLPQENEDFTGKDCIVTGYSHPSDSSAMESDGVLHEAHQHILYQPNCETVLTNFTQHSFRTDEKDMNGLMCASGKYSAEACFSPRDAGSPLACEKSETPGIYYLAGSFSSGFHCGTQEMPVLYTSTTANIKWIMKNIRTE